MSDTNSPDQISLDHLDFQPTCQIDANPAAWALTMRCCSHVVDFACERCKDEFLPWVFDELSGLAGRCNYCHRIFDSAGDNYDLKPL